MSINLESVDVSRADTSEADTSDEDGSVSTGAADGTITLSGSANASGVNGVCAAPSGSANASNASTCAKGAGGQRGSIPLLYMDHKKSILYVPIFLPSTLPKKGWIQCCLVCGTKTAKVFYYFETIKPNVCYMVFCCRNCKIDVDTNDTIRDHFEYYVYEYIDKHQDYIFKKADELVANTPTHIDM